MNGFVDFFRGLGPARLAAMAAVGASLIAFFFFITLRLATPKMALLYSDLDMGDSAKIVTKLQTLSIPYQASQDGATILIPEDRVLDTRMAIAQENLVGSGSVGYELFDKTDTLGTTSFVQNINHVRALEGELARTVRSIDSVISARVHLVLPQRELFSREERKPSASIVVKTRGSLNASQIRAIQNLTASAVPDLDAERVSIIDHRGVLLAKGAGGSDSNLLASTLEEKRVTTERRLREQVETLLERSVGFGKVRAEVAVEMDLSRITTNSETYDPESQVARSTVNVNDSSSELANGQDGAVTVGANLPDGGGEADGQQAGATQSATRSEETVNYEISRTVKTEVHEAGTLKRLSVAVLVDGHYAADAEGNAQYTPRSAEELQQLTSLVRSSVGYNETRGDHVEVINMRFAEAEGSDASPLEINFMGFNKEDLFRMAEIFVLGLVGLLVIFLVLRPLISRMGSGTAAGQAAIGTDYGAGQMHPALMGPDMVMGALPPGQGNGMPVDEHGRPLTAKQIAERPGGLETAIEVASIESKVQTSALKKVGELVERHPDEAVSVVRNWLYGS